MTEKLKKGQKKFEGHNKGQILKFSNFHNFFSFLGLLGSGNSCVSVFLVFKDKKAKKAAPVPQHRKYVNLKLKLSKLGLPT